MFASNIVGNVLAGMIGDRVGHRTTMVVRGAVVCAISVPLFYYLPL